MDEQRAAPDQPELKRPDEAVKDLEPDELEGEAVKGGVKIGGIDGESQDTQHKIEIN